MNEITIAEIIPFSLIDYPELISAVFFTPFCNWRCGYCHNKELWDYSGEGKNYKKFLYNKKGLIDAIVICGGEPTIHVWLPELIEEIKSFGYKIKLDTNGTNPELLKNMSDKIDFVAMDVKTVKNKYSEVAEVDVNMKMIAESISVIRQFYKGSHVFRHTDTGLSFNQLVEMQNFVGEPILLQKKNL